MLAEQHDEWQVLDRRYLSQDAIRSSLLIVIDTEHDRKEPNHLAATA
jgi:hypothetical protein